ncbi:Glucose/ribitol dehydrogenase [Corchorus olitorius]|uniref:Glucose/ribitol dehydrogenase n=1 Tax=Corchorus olitorius TaxID=93759 RepID=A0A1R3K8S5_9ROSI|nr:Glucose/ribitol dehydrogenase [Corchorus olitorius]
MAATAASSLQIAAARPCISSSHRVKAGAIVLGVSSKCLPWTKLASSHSKRAFIAGVADDIGYGWAIAKSLAAAGAEILVGTWVPALSIFETSLQRGKFDESRILPDGSLMEITKIYPLDAVFDNPDDVPEDIKTNRRYAAYTNWTVQEVAESVKQDFGSIDILVHSLANGPEVLAFEAGRKHKIRVNTVSAGPLKSRAAKAIGFIDTMVEYSKANAPLQKELSADEVGNTVAFLASPLASAITGAVIYVDNGLNAMGVGVDSPIFNDLNIPSDKH